MESMKALCIFYVCDFSLSFLQKLKFDLQLNIVEMSDRTEWYFIKKYYDSKINENILQKIVSLKG